MPPPSQQVCTKIGCADGLTLVVEGAPATPYTVEIALPDGRVESQRCEGLMGCEGGLFFENVTAEKLTVRVIADSGTSQSSVRPGYAETQLNGPNCPPTCRQARASVAYQSIQP